MLGDLIFYLVAFALLCLVGSAVAWRIDREDRDKPFNATDTDEQYDPYQW